MNYKRTHEQTSTLFSIYAYFAVASWINPRNKIVECLNKLLKNDFTSSGRKQKKRKKSPSLYASQLHKNKYQIKKEKKKVFFLLFPM